MEKARSKYRILSVIMAILILLVSLPTYAFATLIDDTSEASNTSVSEDDTETSFSKSEVLVLEEDVSLREENIKHFKLSDGTTKAVAYASPVHYKDADGNWIDIDNSLSLNGSEYTANNKSEIKFANKSGSNGLISIKDGEYKIEFTPLNTNKVSVEIENPQENNSRKFDDIKKLNNLISKAKYENIYDGIDLEYILVGNNIKENIIVNQKQDSYSYSFEIKLNKLKAELVENSIILSDYDTGEPIYEIPAPYMLDNNGAYSSDVEYSLTQNSKWKYTFTVSANSEWINDEGRVFPVTIDPTVGVESSVIVDATEYSNTITSTGALKVGEGYKTQISFSSIPNLPKDAYLTDAILSLKYISGEETYVGSYSYNSENISDFNKIVQNTTVNEDGEEVQDGTYGNDGWFSWNIYDIVYEWYKSNVIKAIEFKAVDGENTICFESTETSSENRPILEIAYRDMKGIESYWSYLTQNAGFAGSGAVNLATGNLMFEISTLTTTENIFGYTPSMIYNSAIAGEDYKYGSVQNGYWYSFAATGFKLNMNETLIKKSYLNGFGETEYYYVWADADGTEHYFLQSTKENEENIYYDEDGLQLKLVVDLVDDNEKTYCKIVDSGFNERIFYILGGAPASEGVAVYHLEQLRDKNGNILRFIMDGAHKPNDIKFTPSGTVQTTQLLGPLYNSSGKVGLIWCNETKEGVLFRHSDTPTSSELNPTGGTYLREALYLKCDSSVSWRTLINEFISDTDNQADGITVCASAEYEYDSQGHLVSVYNALSEYTLMYFYDEVGRVSEILEIGNENVYAENHAGQNIKISYFAGYTEVQTSGSDDIFGTEDDLINVYVFDNQGRVVTTYTTNLSRTEVYGAVSGEYDSENENSKNNIKSTTTIGNISPNYLLNGSFENGEATKYWNTKNAIAKSKSLDKDQSETTLIQLDLSTELEAYISQYAYLSSGKYCLSFDIYSAGVLGEVELVVKANNAVIEKAPICKDDIGIENKYRAIYSFDINSPTYANIPIEICATSNQVTAGSIYIDNIMLSKNNANEYNMVTHGGFEKTNTAPDELENTYVLNEGSYWYVPEDIAGEVTINTLMSSNALQIEGNISSFKEVKQDIITQNCYDDAKGQIIFNISGYGYAPQGMRDSAHSEFGIRVYYITKSAGEEATLNCVLLPFVNHTQTWQFAMGTVVIPEYTELLYMGISCVYANNIGTAYFDNICITKNQDNYTYSYEYYEDTGKIKYATDGVHKEFYHYNADGELTNYFTNTRMVEYVYENHKIKTETTYVFSGDLSSKNFKTIYDNSVFIKMYSTTYNYDDYGLITKVETVENSANDNKITTENTYYTNSKSKIFGALKTSTDELGKTSTYFYNETNGNLIAVILPNKEGYSYSYDNLGRLISVLPVTYNGSIYSENANSSEIEYVYDEFNQLEKIVANGMEYTFSYDIYGNSNGVSIGDDVVVSQTRNPYNGKIVKTVYSLSENEFTEVLYEYNTLEQISKITYQNGNEQTVYTYEYNADGNISKITDSSSKITTVYSYNLRGALLSEYRYDSETSGILDYTVYRYDDQDRLTGVRLKTDYLDSSSSTGSANIDVSYAYFYNIQDELYKLNVNLLGKTLNYQLLYKYDRLGRLTNKTVSHNQTHLTQNGEQLTDHYLKNEIEYKYITNQAQTSTQISQYISKITKDENEYISEDVLNFEYDELGNITKVYTINEDDETVELLEYGYDNLGRITREENSYTGKIYTYQYDTNGNILSENVYDKETNTLLVTNTYSYSNENWKDQLTSYNGSTIEYNQVGNPTKYLNFDFAWNEMNYLTGIYEDGKLIASYTYNENGIRTSKTENGVTHNYILNGTQVMFESYDDIFIVYIYDENGAPIGMAYRDDSIADSANEQDDQFTYYLFTKNLQGDIIGIYNEEGTLVAEYTYNAWGEHTVINHTSANIGNINPFRYRGYFYDSETGFYYLNTRYYDPQVKRFISADSIEYLGADGDLQSYNLYSYCGSNPVMGYDPMGTWDWGTFVNGATLLVVGVTAVAIAVSVASCGTATPVMLAVASVAIVAGTATAINGVSEMVEAGTGYNVVRDGLMGGDEEKYESYKETMLYAAEFSIVILGAYTAASGGSVCFVAGTMVLTESGHTAIENIEAGDFVWATNPETDETELKQVVRTFKNETTELVHIKVNGETITCTNEHPFYSPVKGWTAACKLKAGDMLVTLNGEYVIVEWVQHEILESPVAVYNFEVEDFHTYYVGDNDGILVHNRCKPKTEVHHIVEQCQVKKTGFSNSIIQSPSNKVTLDYDVHRKVSGYYSSSKLSFTKGLRVRDWLAGQSFEFQTEFGWKIIKMFRGY